VPAYGVRQVILETDGTVFVSISIVVNSAAVALGLVEGIPAGWQLEPIEAGGATTRVNNDTRQFEVAWMSQAEAGDEVTFTYRLYSGYSTQTGQLSGEVSGYVGGVRFVASVCGELAVP
jgi:hypothetical protein